MNNDDNFNENHYILYHANHFLASPEGKQVVKTSLASFPHIQDAIKTQVQIHDHVVNKVLNKSNAK